MIKTANNNNYYSTNEESVFLLDRDSTEGERANILKSAVSKPLGSLNLQFFNGNRSEVGRIIGKETPTPH